MKIEYMKTNHVTNPLGFAMTSVSFQWMVTGSRAKKLSASRIRVASDGRMKEILYDSKETELDWTGTEVSLTLQPQTRYYWQVWARDDQGEETESEVAWFETAKKEKEWDAAWISPLEDNRVVFHEFSIEKPIEKARLSITGLGLYEVYVNQQKVGDEFLTPNFNSYFSWTQFQTYPVENCLKPGKNLLEVVLGDGWYPAMCYVKYGAEAPGRVPKYAALAQLDVWYQDGSRETIGTDETWKSRKSFILQDGIFYGESQDATADTTAIMGVKRANLGYEHLEARRSLPVKVKQIRKPEEIIVTSKGETVLDFGQNMAGWVCFFNRLPKGSTCNYWVGEILQDGCFYRENLRGAKAEFHYTSNGERTWVRPHFTYYGFRYVKLEGFEENVKPGDFEAWVLYSDVEETGEIHTGHEKVNQLISNIVWSQRGNFIDNPTDCPQRDERMGWAGDAQMFSMTAAYNMDVSQFFNKYVHDMLYEQKKNHGSVFMVPSFTQEGQASAGWGDAATIIPWNMYLMYGDKHNLLEQYENMKCWVTYILGEDERSGNTRLWTTKSHFGDWLSMDAKPGVLTGRTEMDLIATAYYYYSVSITGKAAQVLKKQGDAAKYRQLATEIRTAFQKEFLTEGGRLTSDTQTAYTLVLYMGLYREGQEKKLIERLARKIYENHGYLDTGFIGTPYLCQVLSKFGENRLAYRILLNEGTPGWLYEVNMGATTVWERWDSVLPDGHMNPAGMNSLNHYAYGAVMEWMYRYMAGIQPLEESPGWKQFRLAPMPDLRIGKLNAKYRSVAGWIVSSWEYDENRILRCHFEIPFGTLAQIELPDAENAEIRINGKRAADIRGMDGKAIFTLDSGVYDICYEPAHIWNCGYHADMELSELLKDEKVKTLLLTEAPELLNKPDEYLYSHAETLRDAYFNVFTGKSSMELEKLNEKLRLLSERS